jgi:hypothetical protein
MAMISDNSVSCVFNYKNDQEIRIELTPFELMEILRIIKIILCTMGG